jgi:DNA polymerase (family X)
MITREQLQDILEKIAQLLEIKGENPFKVRAYRQGAEAVSSYAGDIVAKAAANELTGIAGIGEALRQKLHELASTGKLEFYEKLRAEFPVTIFELFDITGLGPKKIAALYKELGVGSLAELKTACESGAAAGLSGFGAKTATKLLEAIAFRETNAGIFRVGEVAADVERILEFLRSHPTVLRAEVAGSYRRGKETVHDLDFVTACSDGPALMADFTGQSWVTGIIVQGATKSSIRLASGIQCDLRAVKNAEFPFALNYFTGSKEHNVAMRSLALKKGWSLNEYRLENCADEIYDEPALYRAFGLDYIAPELREDRGEIDAAAAGRLPRLVEIGNLRGTFHNHTTASDGTASLEAMAEAAQELGLQYLGIADHSKAAVQANGLDEKRLAAQLVEIARLNASYGESFRLFSGSEVDILKDGSLDFSDEVMAQLDYVVASVHNVFTLSEADMTARLIRAMENPHVTMIGHLTGRLLLKREPYAVNIPAILDAAVATGTVIELNAHPLRLDLDWRWWPQAKAKGVKTSINPDAHTIHGLQDIVFGTRIARKGGLTREDVLNCLPLAEVTQALQAKRRRMAAGG